MNKRECPVCSEPVLKKPKTLSETYGIRGEEITVEAQGHTCTGCGHRFLADGKPWDSADAAYREYRARHEMLLPEDIRAFRLRMDMTQDELATLLSCSRVTVSRYENGALQEASHDSLMKTAMSAGGFGAMLANSPFSEQRRREFTGMFNSTGTTPQEALEGYLGSPAPSEYNGYSRPDAGKLIAALLYFCRNGVSRTKINKLLFYADFLHFKSFGVSITGASYAHLPFGPCLDQYEHILAILLQDRKLLRTRETPCKGVEDLVEVLESTIAPDLSILSPTEMQVLASVAHQLEGCSAVQLSERSHAEKGFTDTQTGRLISYEFARDLKLGLARGG
jgi:putative zinc finger/helix-turn-helix YgiT family protein